MVTAMTSGVTTAISANDKSRSMARAKIQVARTIVP
jgi:hypothetical protein